MVSIGSVLCFAANGCSAARDKEIGKQPKTLRAYRTALAKGEVGILERKPAPPLQKGLRETLKMPGEFVLHSLRHSYGTRLGEVGADAFTIMRLMGHSSVTVRQRYAHPTPEALEMAVERLESLNQKATKRLVEGGTKQLRATIPATLQEPVSVTH